jgi:hypothetical protein
MEYIQGFVHDSFAKNHYYEFNMDFTMVVCNNVRYSEYDFDKDGYGMDFEKGYIICIKFFKAKEESHGAYTYLEGFYNLEGFYTKVNQETIMSREFVSANSEEVGGKLLIDVSKKMNRNNKIDLILE